MLVISIGANVLLFTFAVTMAWLWRDYRRRLYIREGRDLGWPIRTVPLAEFDERFANGEHGPSLETEVQFIGRGDGVPGGTSDREAWILAVLTTDARELFEFGTCTGKTSYLWARNSPDDARITTLTLRGDDSALYRRDRGDSHRATRNALLESRFERFVYNDTPVESKIDQLFGDSKEFDEEPYVGSCDLVFVDGSHAYSYVKSDSEKALRMVAPGGLILWHDYRDRGRSTRDVFVYLNELARDRDLVHLVGTSLVAYRESA